MSRLLSGRRPSLAANNLLRKSHHHSFQIGDAVLSATATTQHTPPPAASITNKLHEKQARSYILKLENKLPCNSGHALSAIEEDPVVEQVVLGLIHLAAGSPDYTVWSLCRLLEKLQNRAWQNDKLSEDVLDSQLFILKTLTRVLNSRWIAPAAPGVNDIVSPRSSLSLGHSPFPPSLSATSSPHSTLSSNSLPHIQSSPYPSNKPSQSSLHTNSTATSVSWIEPAPLDDAIVRYALSVALIFLRDNFNTGPGGGSHAVHEVRSLRPGARASGSMFAWDVIDWEPALSPPLRARNRADNALNNLHNIAWEQTAFPVQGASDLGMFGQGGSARGGSFMYTMYAHEYARDMALHGSYMASVPVLVTKYAGRIVYNLSASNWPVVFARIAGRLRSIADDKDFGTPSSSLSHGKTTSGSRYAKGALEAATGVPDRYETDDCVDLRLLSVCIIDRSRLKSVLQEFSTLFMTMSPFAQDVACIALRTAVQNWIENFPRELAEMWVLSSPKKNVTRRDRMMDGIPERVFDILHDTSNQHIKRAAWLYPTLASLISISPERLESSTQVMEGTVKGSKKGRSRVSLSAYTYLSKKQNSFLKQLSDADKVSPASPINNSTTLGEHAAFAYLDIVRAAFVLPPAAPGQEEPALRVIGVQLAHELKHFMLHPTLPYKPFYASTQPIDVNFYAYCIAAVFRFHPQEALRDVVPICLEPQRSAAVKLAVVKALVLIAVEAPKYPWQPSLDPAYPVITPRIRSICQALLAGRAEVIGGVTIPASTVPTCKSLVEAARVPDLSSEIDENVRLVVQLETLFAHSPEFWLHGTKDEDHVGSLEDVKLMFGPSRDKRAKAATMMGLCATLTRTLHCPLDAPWYPESMRCLWYIMPAGFVTVSLLLLNAGGTDHEFHRTAAACLHTLLLNLMEGSPYDQDDSWRFSPMTAGAMPLVELALWTALSSSQMDISVSAQRCLRLMSVIERNPAFPAPNHLTSEDFSKRCTVLEGLGDPLVVIVGRIAFLKRICKHISMLSFATPTHTMMFRQFLHRWMFLTGKVDHKRHGPGTEPATKDEFHEWQNKMYILAVSGGCLMTDEPLVFPQPLDAILPSHLQGPAKPADLVRQFILALVSLLSSDTLAVREATKEAIGHELSMRLVPMLLGILMEETQKQLELHASRPNKSTLIFVEQVLVSFYMLVERIDVLESVFNITTGAQGISLGKFISSVPLDTGSLRLRSRYCATMDALLAKRHYIAIRFENTFRGQLVELLAGWIKQQPVASQSNDEEETIENHKAAMGAHIAALKTFVRAVETFHIDASENTPTEHLRTASRQFHSYLTILINTLVPIKVQEFSESPEFDRLSNKSAQTHSNEALVNELVVAGIAHLLNNNIEAGMKHCLALCYDENFRLRVVLMKAFTRVLNLGTKFELQVRSSNAPHVVLCELLRDCQMILSALVEVCPSGDVDRMVPVLLHVFNTRPSLLSLVKLLVNKEVSRAGSPTQLFRSNDLCIRLLSVFARQHGYIYLRSILVRLIEAMMDLPTGCSFELDPSKLPAGEDPAANVQTLMTITQAFIDIIVDSVTTLPPVLREISHHIGKVVHASWPESKYNALGAFLFLRFICPAIVSPETVDVELSRQDPRSPSIRRGLMLVAKIIQNLANNVSFVKERYLMVLNPFLEKNVRPVNKYLSTAPLFTPVLDDDGQKLGPGCDDTDSLVLHRFFQAHMDEIGKNLLNRKEPESQFSKFSSGKDAWDTLCAQLVELGTALEAPHLSGAVSSEHVSYQRFMAHNHDRDTNPLNNIFAQHASSKGQTFVFTFAKVDIEILDCELLIYLILKTVNAVVAQGFEFDIIFDFTEFTARSEFPVAWLRLVLELLPSDFRKKWRSAFILNLNSLSQVFLRKALCIFSDLGLALETSAFSSVVELQEYFGQGFMMSSNTAILEYQKIICFEDVQQQIQNTSWNPVYLYIGEQHLRIVSVKAQPITPSLSARLVEIIPLYEIEDVYKGSDACQVVVRMVRRTLSMTLSSTASEQILKSLQIGKQRAITFKPALLPTSQVSDLSATLLAIGMLHACHQFEYVRGAAYELLTANCAYMRYPSDAHVPWRGSFIPANSLAFVINFSERMSNFAPHMTFDFISEWSVGFSGAAPLQKITCLQYLSPWLRNMSSSFNPKSALFDVSGTKVRDCIHIFMKISMEDAEVYPVLQRAVWMELGKSTPALLDIIVDEFIRVAVDSGSGSRRCELVADTLIAVSSIHTRAKVLKALRMHVTRACNKPTRALTEAAEWKAISALSRLALVAGHSPRLAIQNQLYAPEIAHLVTMLAATGTFTMRSSIYGMAVNLLQALHVARADDEAVAVQLRLMLDNMASPEVLKIFGLNRQYPSSEISVLEPLSDQICVESLEKITHLLRRSLELGSANDGLRNVWEARWTSLVTSIAFQASFQSQSRAFTILGSLAGSAVDDDIVYQMLVAFKTNLFRSHDDNDMSAALSMLRCMRKALPGLPRDSRYLVLMFWLAVSIIQAGYTTCYGEALRLLQASVEAMDQQKIFCSATQAIVHPMESTLMEARGLLHGATLSLDELSGLSFETDFGFALVLTLWRGIRVRADIKVLQGVLYALLAASLRAANSQEDQRRRLDRLSTPLFMALAPCMGREQYVRILEVDFHITNPCRDMPLTDERGDEFRTYLDLLTMTDVNTVLLATGLLLSLDASYILDEQEKENIHFYWEEFARSYPDSFASGVFHFMDISDERWISYKMDTLFSQPSSPEHMHAITSCFDIIMSRSAHSTSERTLAASSTTIRQENATTQSSSPFDDDAFAQTLTKIGMIGAIQPFRAPSDETKSDPRRGKAVGCIPMLIDLILAQ